VFGEGDVQVRAVRGVDLEVRTGEVVLIMGPSGSGKTTLLSMLGAMLRPSAGRVEVDGVDLASLAEKRLPAFRARRFGFVFQDFNLLSALTVRENVELALNLAGVTGRPARERAERLLRDLGLG
jgi:putative ABC transport system ATP-binding protein